MKAKLRQSVWIVAQWVLVSCILVVSLRFGKNLCHVLLFGLHHGLDSLGLTVVLDDGTDLIALHVIIDRGRFLFICHFLQLCPLLK